MKAFVFPGQGVQTVGMGKDFYDNSEVAKSVYEIASKASNLDVEGLCFEENDKLNITEYTQIALLATEVAILRVIEKKGIKTFKVEAKRADKHFPFKSPEICAEVGGKILEEYPHIRVDVHNPDLVVMVEIRDQYAYIHGNQIKGAGGMPVGSAGRAALLVSGGIDSPVAGWMMAKRGLNIVGVHFASPPYTSQRAEMKVHTLCKKVAQYCGHIPLFVIPFTRIQEEIKEKCPEDLFTIIMRRFMMRCAEIIAEKEECGALITGESVGQVASQTMQAIACTDAVPKLPVFRPLIGMDKDEVVAISRKIDTFETSILPYEDCCTVFTPKHPRTRPKLYMLEEAEQALDVDALVKDAIDNMKFIMIDR